MLFINVKSRLLNKAFWVSLISLLVLLSQEFGFDISTIIPKNYTNIINTIFAILALLGIVVDTSTPGINDKIISDATVQAINKATETKEEVKIEDSTTGINGVITENSQSNSDNASTSASDKESEINSNIYTSSNVQVNTDNSIATSSNDNATPVIDPIAIQAENKQLKATLNQIQLFVTDNITTPSNS